jgi:1-acyl-sn-glycerol-3-phosphate acyltransferase
MIAFLRAPLVLLVILSCGPVMLVTPFCRGMACRLRIRRWYFATLCWLLGFRMRVEGKLSDARPLLIASNHLSYTDILVQGSLFPGINFIAKGDITSWPLLGPMIAWFRPLFISRKAGETRGQITAIREYLAEEGPLVLYAEGTSGDGTGVLPFKPSLFAVAEEPIHGHPVTVQALTIAYRYPGGGDLPPTAWYGDMSLVPHLWGLLHIPRLEVILTLHPPLSAGLTRKEMAAQCHAQVAARYGDCHSSFP